MAAQKDNSTLYAIVVIIIIAIIITGTKMYDSTPIEPEAEYESIVQEPSETFIADTAAIESSRFDYLYKYDGQYPSEVNLLQNTEINSRLILLLGQNRVNQISEYWNVEVPISIQQGMLIAKGCQQHNCDETSFIIIVDIENDIVSAGVKLAGITELFSERSEVPTQLEVWRTLVDNTTVQAEPLESFGDYPTLVNYYEDIVNESFEASKYFADHVYRYLSLKDVSPQEINQSYFHTSREVRNQQYHYDASTFEHIESIGDVHYFSFLLFSEGYRIQSARTERSEIRVEVGFNANGKIVFMKHAKIESMIYSN